MDDDKNGAYNQLILVEPRFYPSAPQLSTITQLYKCHENRPPLPFAVSHPTPPWIFQHQLDLKVHLQSIITPSAMDYLELDNAATQAFEELGGDFDLPHAPSRPSKSMNTSNTSRTRPRRRVEASYLLRLEHPFSTPCDVANALGRSRVPRLEGGVGEDGEAGFCRLSQSSINALDTWIEKYCLNEEFTKIRIGLAHKDPGELPLLGRDLTLPHHRPNCPVMGTPAKEHE